ncbi:MAG: WYL domain-containing protein [Bacteroidales bacterium]|jgi:hypothetical protein|nr:WYL domain-containing protein [Bacteroidales bacterium]
MVTELLNKYIWLVRTLADAGEEGLSLEELSDMWVRKFGPAEDGQERYPRRSFNNHRTAIAEVFGIAILCNRSTNRYYISNSNDITDGNSRISWLIDMFTVNNSLTADKEKLADRVSVEKIPSGHKYLTLIMDAMMENRQFIMHYMKYSDNKPEKLHINPYALKESEKRWYLIGYCIERAGIRVYGLDRIVSIDLSETVFKLPENFDLDELFATSYGIFLPKKGEKAVTITFKATPKNAKYIRDLKLHESQEEIGEEDGKPVFRIHVIPNDSLIMDLCRFGDGIEIIKPLKIRNKVRDYLSDALEQYGSSPDSDENSQK